MNHGEDILLQQSFLDGELVPPRVQAPRRKNARSYERQLLRKSTDSYVMALETINRISIRYRVEAFLILLCNAWELLLKARMVSERGVPYIWHRDSASGERISKSLDQCLEQIYGPADPVRRNLEFLVPLRHKAVHLFLPVLPNDVMSLAQASVVNYHNELREWFGTSLSDTLPVGMMAIVFDVSPDQFDPTRLHMRRRLGKRELDYLKLLQHRIHSEPDEVRYSPRFAMTVEHRVAFEKRAATADGVALYTDRAGALTVDRPRDPSVTHPLRFMTVVRLVGERVPKSTKFNQYHLTCIERKHKVAFRHEWFQQNSIEGAPKQYSPEFVDWIVDRVEHSPGFLNAATIPRSPARRPRKPTAVQS